MSLQYHLRNIILTVSGSRIHRLINVMLLTIISVLVGWLIFPPLRTNPLYIVGLLTSFTILYGGLYWYIFIHNG